MSYFDMDTTDITTTQGRVTLTEGFSLVLGNDDGTIDNADVRVRWCVTPELTKQLEDANVENPHVLLCTYNEAGRHEWRQFFPLNEVISFARFYQAGPMHIAAYIVELSGTPTETKKVKHDYLRHDAAAYTYDMQQDGELCRSVEEVPLFHALTHEIIDIPKGVFDKEAPAWLEWYANLWHGRGGPDDACSFRTRCILGIVKWIPMTVWMVFYYCLSAIMIGGCWLLGFGKWIANPRALKYPFVADTAFTVLDSDEGEHNNLYDSRFIAWLKWSNKGVKFVKDTSEEPERYIEIQPLWTTAMLAPLWPVLIACVTWLTAEGYDGILLFHHVYSTTVDVMVGMVSLALAWDICVIIGNIIEFFVKKATDRSRKEMGIDGITVIIAALIVFLASVAFSQLPFIFVSGFLIIGFVSVWIFSKPWASEGFDRYLEKLDDMYDWVVSWFGVKDDYTMMRELMCPDDLKNLSTNMNTLPRKNVSWTLRFKNMKAAVCKPRARRG